MFKRIHAFVRDILFHSSKTHADEVDSATSTVVDTAPRTARAEIATGRSFEDFPLDKRILRGLREADFIRCTEIQERTLPHALAGKDIAAQAQTGSGKTAVFLITIFQKLLELEKNGRKARQALILAPTRELALQIYRDAGILGRFCNFRYAVILGGLAYEKQIKDLKNAADIVIATPGRLIDLIKQQLFDPLRVTLLVIDEADRMLDMGFIRDLRYIMRRLPHYKKRQSLLFSATLSLRVLELTYEYMNVAEEIRVSPDKLVVDTVEQVLHHVGKEEKFSLLLGLLKREKWDRVLIFANTKAQAISVARKLTANGYHSNAITGDLPQKRRIAIMNRFRSGAIPVLVATDVASRGLHIEDVSHVINYDVPQDREEYVHRIGRTARAGKTGKAITLASENDVYNLQPIEELLGKKIPVVWPDDDWFVVDRSRDKRRSAHLGSKKKYAHKPRVKTRSPKVRPKPRHRSRRKTLRGASNIQQKPDKIQRD